MVLRLPQGNSTRRPINYPGRRLHFRFLNLLVRLAPVREKFYDNSILLRRNLSSPLPSVAPAPHVYGWARAADIDFISAHRQVVGYGFDEGPAAVHARRLKRGHLCFCAKKDEEVISYRWVAFDWCYLRAGTPDELRYFPLREGQAYRYDLYTFEQHRRTRVASGLSTANLHALRDLGIKEAYNAVNPRNAGSMKIHLRLGAEPQCFLYGYKVLNWKKTFQGSTRGLDSFTQWARQFYGIQEIPASRG